MEGQLVREGGMTTVAVGPWGAKAGTEWSDDPANIDGIKKISIYSMGCIDSISVTYISNYRDHDGGKEMTLDFPDEHITEMRGYLGTFGYENVVKSLTFTTNTGQSKTFGTEEGTPFTLPIKNGRIHGFHGTSTNYITTIGVHISPQ